MAFSFKRTRYSAIAQIILGSMCVIFGIADRATIFKFYPVKHFHQAFHTESLVPIWMGAWIVITGIIGFAASRRSRNRDKPSVELIGAYLGFSIISVIFTIVIIVLYTIGGFVVFNGITCTNSIKDTRTENACNTSTALGSMVVLCAIIEFFVGIWACICSCSGGGCRCCYEPIQQSLPQTGQVIYIQTQHGPAAYVMTQGADNGIPVAVPMTADHAGMTPMQEITQPFVSSAGVSGTRRANESQSYNQPPAYRP